MNTAERRHVPALGRISPGIEVTVEHPEDPDGRSGSLRLLVDPELPLFAGHFPGNPLLPGVAQLDLVISAAAICFPALAASRFTGLMGVKFKAPVRPGDQIHVDVTLEGQDGDSPRVGFALRHAGVICTRGTLCYGASA